MPLSNLLKGLSSINYPTLIIGAIIGGIISTLLKVWIEERVKMRRMRRMIIGPGGMPRFTLTMTQGGIEMKMLGDYSVMNHSDLPVNLQFPKASLLGFNRASRAFQFKVNPRNTEQDLKKSLDALLLLGTLNSRQQDETAGCGRIILECGRKRPLGWA